VHKADSLAFSSRPIDVRESCCSLASCNMHECLILKSTSIQILGSRLSIASFWNNIQHRANRETQPDSEDPEPSFSRQAIILSKMASFSTLDDMRSLRAKIDQKAHDLFKSKPGQAPLTVTRVFNSQESKSKGFEKDREVWTLPDIKRFPNVRTPELCIPSRAPEYCKVIVDNCTKSLVTNIFE
jgi:hypothetical protein